MKDTNKLLLLLILSILLTGMYIFESDPSYYILLMRINKLIGILLVSVSIAISSYTFQTITNNNILTPGILGFDSLFILINCLTIFITSRILPAYILYPINISIMVGLALLLFKFLFKFKQIYKILFIGTIIGILFRSMISVIFSCVNSVMFDIMQSFTFANFSVINNNLVLISIIPVMICSILIYNNSNELDIYLLGESISSSLGLDVKKFISRNLILITILVSISTTLIGPIVFLGLFISNITRILFSTYKHTRLIPNACIIGYLMLLGGVYLDERIFYYANISIILEGLGALYFIYLCLKE